MLTAHDKAPMHVFILGEHLTNFAFESSGLHPARLSFAAQGLSDEAPFLKVHNLQQTFSLITFIKDKKYSK